MGSDGNPGALLFFNDVSVRSNVLTYAAFQLAPVSPTFAESF